MDRRLDCIYNCIDRNARGVMDVGTDHGYLPAELAKNGFTGLLVASDIHPGPLAAAERTAKEKGVSDKIRFVLRDGLCDEYADSVDTLVIAGMGGDLICRILDRADWAFDPRYTLILQPMTKQEILRYYLTNNGFEIRRENIVADRGRLYSVLCSSFTGQNASYTPVELYLGRTEICSDLSLYRERLTELASECDVKKKGSAGKPEAAFWLELERSIADSMRSL